MSLKYNNYHLFVYINKLRFGFNISENKLRLLFMLIVVLLILYSVGKLFHLSSLLIILILIGIKQQQTLFFKVF